ncbi:MAG: hypothetical protein LUC30_01555, partial [Clostridiales bacterium]|nr:hypothetical protein [Clostridiales bacterium]
MIRQNGDKCKNRIGGSCRSEKKEDRGILSSRLPPKKPKKTKGKCSFVNDVRPGKAKAFVR